MSDYANIICKSIELPFGKRRIEYEWSGESNKALVSRETLTEITIQRHDQPFSDRIGFDFWFGDLHLVITDSDPIMLQYELALADGQGYQLLYNRRLYYFLDNLKCRFILTLYVWGLAHLEQSERITWNAVRRKKGNNATR